MSDHSLRDLERRVARGESQRGELVLAALRAGSPIHWSPRKKPCASACGIPALIYSDDLYALQAYTENWAVPWPGVTCGLCLTIRRSPLPGSIIRLLEPGVTLHHGLWQQGPSRSPEPFRVRTTGRTKEWKTMPDRWERNVAHGMLRNGENFLLGDYMYRNLPADPTYEGRVDPAGTWGPWFLDPNDAREWRLTYHAAKAAQPTESAR